MDNYRKIVIHFFQLCEKGECYNLPRKYYAVKKGYNPGVYSTWKDCQSQVSGFSNALFKVFESYEDAEKYMENDDVVKIPETEAIAYVDGSCSQSENIFSYGVVIFWKGEEHHFCKRYVDSPLFEMRNVAGEIKGAQRAMRYCLNHGIKSITIYHDYEGISRWCTGDWEAKKDGTKKYRDYYNKASKTVDIYFVKVKGHSGDKYNDLADKLAKKGLCKRNFW